MQLIGTDIIEIDRIKRAQARWGTRFLDRVYTGAELGQCRMRLSSLAGRFAGKEAALKALGTETSGISWKDVEILTDATGKPMVNLYGKAQVQANYLHLENLVISLSHSREYALAVVIGEAEF